MEMLINLVIQLISGVVGGNAVGAALKDYNLGSLGNTIAGALGGVGWRSAAASRDASDRRRGRRQPRCRSHHQSNRRRRRWRRDPHGHRRACEEHGDERADALSTGALRVADQRS